MVILLTQLNDAASLVLKPISDSIKALLKGDKNIVFILLAVAVLAFATGYLTARPVVFENGKPVYKNWQITPSA